MSETNIFERAAKNKTRFASSKGQLTVEDLFDLSLTDLDKMAKAINKALSEEGEGTFLTSSSTSKTATENRLRFDLVLHVIRSREAANAASKTRAEKQAQISQIRELVQAKQNEAMAGKSVEELMKQLAELEAAVV